MVWNWIVTHSDELAIVLVANLLTHIIISLHSTCSLCMYTMSPSPPHHNNYDQFPLREHYDHIIISFLSTALREDIYRSY